MKQAKKWLPRVAIALLTVSAMEAQQRGGPGMMYNPSTETTIKGTVEAVASQGAHGMMMGTHLTVKSDQATTDVMLGPSNFISSQGFTFAKGDEVQVTGSKVPMGGTEVLVAREVAKGGKTLVLRDKTGKPKWSGGAQGRHGPPTPKEQ